MIKKLLYSCSLALGLLVSGCAQDDWLTAPGSDVPDRDYAEIELAVAEPQTVRTRAGYTINDAQIDNATVLIYRGDNKKFLQGKTFNKESSGSLSTIKIEYDAAVKEYCRDKNISNTQLYLFVVANHNFGSSYPQTVDDLYTLEDIAATGIPSRSTVVMAGFAGDTGELNTGVPGTIKTVSKATLNQTVTVKMARNLSRVYVENTADKFELEQFCIRSAAPKAYLCAGITKGVFTTGMEAGTTGTVHGEYQNGSNGNNKNYAYAYGQKALGGGKDKLDEDNRAYVIVKGLYDMETCYYRIDLRKDNGAGASPRYEYLYLTPNHEYQIKITKVNCKGYATPEEAAKHPQEDFVEFEVYDIVPSVMSMTSDGQRELGVETPAYISKNAFALKLFSKIGASEYPTVSTSNAKEISTADGRFKIEVISGDWLALDGMSEPESSWSGNNKDGKLYSVGVKSTSTLTTGTQTGKVLVTWQGLSREVEVIWENEFDLSDIVTAKMQVTYPDKSYDEFEDYWQFLKKREETYSGDRLLGVDKSMCGGDIRNQGIHLPVGIGGKNKKDYEYLYTLTVDSKYTGDISVKFIDNSDGTNIQFATSALTINQTARTITIKANAASFGNNYFTGKMQITAGTQKLPEIDVYHTGFFWNVADGDQALTKIKGGAVPETGWYYYEIRRFGDRMWLDRNICATSNGMAIVSTSGNLSGGEEFNNASIGGYYTPADGVDYAQVEEKLWTELCPPGFRIPKTNEWDEIRNSFAFNNSETVAGSVTYFQANIMDDNGKMIYFPKAMYYSNSTLTGDSRAGYYWTSSEAAGLEKQQIGHWLKALVFSGGANSYMHGNVDKYGMQIRAVEIDDTPVKKYTIGFKVKGATHVYIYDAREPFSYDGTDKGYRNHEDDIKSGLITWPGIAIGEASTMSCYYNKSNETFYKNYDSDNNTYSGDPTEYTFTYTTTTPKEYLRFVFCYVENGKIYVFSLNDNSDGIGAEKYNGWPLLESYSFGFTNKDDKEFHWATTGDIDNNDGEITTYKFFFKEHPTYQGGKPNEWPKGGTVLTNGNTMINAHWDDSRWEKVDIDGTNYYVFTMRTDKEIEKWKYNWRYNEGTNVTYSIKGGPDKGTVQSPDLLVYDSDWDARCVTINDIADVTQTAGAPGSTPVTTTYTYKLNGNFTGSWNMTDMSESGGKVTATVNITNASAEFSIQRIDQDDNVSWINPTNGNETVVLNTEISCQNGGNNFQFSNADSGEYTFEYTPSTQKLKVTKKAVVTNDKYLVVRAKASDIQSDLKFIYAWAGSDQPFGVFNSAPEATGTKDGYRYWRVMVTSDVNSLDGVILKAAKDGNGDNRVDFSGSSYYTKETNSTTLSNYEATYMFTLKTRYTYRFAWYKDDESSVNFRDAIHYEIGGEEGWRQATNSATIGDETRYYIDITLPMYRSDDSFKSKDYVQLYKWNGTTNNTGNYTVKDKKGDGGTEYDFLITIY